MNVIISVLLLSLLAACGDQGHKKQTIEAAIECPGGTQAEFYDVSETNELSKDTYQADTDTMVVGYRCVEITE